MTISGGTVSGQNLFQDTILEFASIKQGKPQTNLISITGLSAEI